MDNIVLNLTNHNFGFNLNITNTNNISLAIQITINNILIEDWINLDSNTFKYIINQSNIITERVNSTLIKVRNNVSMNVKEVTYNFLGEKRSLLFTDQYGKEFYNSLFDIKEIDSNTINNIYIKNNTGDTISNLLVYADNTDDVICNLSNELSPDIWVERLNISDSIQQGELYKVNIKIVIKPGLNIANGNIKLNIENKI